MCGLGENLPGRVRNNLITDSVLAKKIGLAMCGLGENLSGRVQNNLITDFDAGS